MTDVEKPADYYSDMWLPPSEDPRSLATAVPGERPMLLEYLHNYRLTLELKCSGLSTEELARRSVPPSTMSLLGLLRHLAKVENAWHARMRQGRLDGPPLYWSPEDHDLDFNGALADEDVVADAWATWRREVALADTYIATIPSLDDAVITEDGDSIEIREILVHLIEEYARHCGHADLLRECIDGRTGQ